MTGRGGKEVDVKPEDSRRILNRPGAYSLLLVVSLIFGLAFVAVREADFRLSPINFALLRWFIAGAGYLVIFPFLGRAKTKFERKDLLRLLLISFASVPAYHLSLNYAETTISAGLAGLLNALAPVFTVLLSRISLKENVGRTLVLALVIAVMGAALISFPDLNGSTGSVIGPFEAMLAALAYSTFAVMSKPLVQKYGALPVAIRSGAIGTVMLLPLLSPTFLVQVSAMTWTGWISVLYLSIIVTVMGYSMFYALVGRGAVSRLIIQLYLVPVFSVIGGILFLGEAVSIYTVTGGAALLIAIALATRSQVAK